MPPGGFQKDLRKNIRGFNIKKVKTESNYVSPDLCVLYIMCFVYYYYYYIKSRLYNFNIT